MNEPRVFEGLEVLKRYLGGHPANPDQRWLHKQEVFSLLMWAGRCAGFTVKTEVPVELPDGRAGNIDCGWFDSQGGFAVAWEIDGRDVHDSHVFGAQGTRPRAGTLEKLEACFAALKVQVLYSLCNDLSAKGPSSEPRLRARFPPAVYIVTDMMLMTSGTFEEITREAFGRAS